MTSPYLVDDERISVVARELRGYSDADLARFPDLSPVHIAALCEFHGAGETLLRLAVIYEQARRKAFGAQAR